MIKVESRHEDGRVKHKELYDKDLLTDLCVNKSLSVKEIAELYNASTSTIYNILKRYNIPHFTVNKEDVLRSRGVDVDTLKDKDKLNYLYNIEYKSIHDIAKICNTNYNVARDYVINAGIERRDGNSTRSERRKRELSFIVEDLTKDAFYEMFVIQKIPLEDIAKKYGLAMKEIRRIKKKYKIYKERKERIIQHKDNNPELNENLDYRLRDRDLLYELYIIEEKSMKEIADLCGTYYRKVGEIIDYFGIKRRTQKESAKLLVGEKSPHWKGVNYSLYDKVRGYSRDNLHKLSKERDNYTCQRCGKHENLQTHHITPLWKIYETILKEHPELDHVKDQDELLHIIKNDPRINDLSNLVTYCEDCHLFHVHGYSKKQVESIKSRSRLKYYN